MEDQTNKLAPTVQSERISSIDTLRGVALLGILMMNIPFFSASHLLHNNLAILGEYTGPNFWCWAVVNGFFDGSMRGLFSMLFGAGSILLISRLEKKNTGINPADIYYRRLIWLFLFGMVNAFIFQWPGDILYAYSICGLFLFPFRNLKPGKLIWLACALFVIATFFINLDLKQKSDIRKQGQAAIALEHQGAGLSNEQLAAKNAWLDYQEKNKPENALKDVNESNEVMRGNWLQTFEHHRHVNVWIQTEMMYNEYFLDVMMMFFIGMALFKWGVLNGSRSRKFYWLMFLCYIPGSLLGYWYLHGQLAANFDASLLLDQIKINLYHLKRITIAFGHIGLIMLLYKYGIFKFLLRGLSSVGQMAFTNYLMQSIICTFIFLGYGLGFFGKLQRYQTYEIVCCVWIFQIIFSNIWLRYFRFGPFEWLWRSLTYWKKQPFLRIQNPSQIES